MADADITTKILASKKGFFADLFNTFVFNGEEKINVKNLDPLDTTMSVILDAKFDQLCKHLPLKKRKLFKSLFNNS
jgi:hypothetical protein